MGVVYQASPIAKEAREKSPTLYVGSIEYNFERHLISQCLRRKMCGEILLTGPEGRAFGWSLRQGGGVGVVFS